MTQEKSQYWFVPLTEIQQEAGADLRPARSQVVEGDRLVKEGEAFTITDFIHDYMVIKIIPGIVHSGDSSELLLNQQIASVLSHLEENDEGKQREHFKFLQETIQFASNINSSPNKAVY